jgi:hypothetical protein
MKTKFYLVLIAGILVSANTFAQSFGLKAGINASNLKASAEGVSLSLDSKVGLNLGAFAEFDLAEKFALQTELNLSEMGAQFSGVKENLTYLAIPALPKLKFGNFGLYLGPQVSFLLSAKDKYEGESESVTSSFKPIDFSAIGGAEVVIAEKLVLSTRYQIGLTNIAKESDGGKLVNNGATFSVGFKF